jgi:putative tryptophan/tyrosine transport system substrate-binding protein
MMRRRDFITFLGAAVLWPPLARAQQPAPPVIGFLSDGSREAMTRRVAAFQHGLDELGYAEGRSVTIDWRSAERQPERLPALATDLVGRRVAAIVTASDLATSAALAATSTTPIVFLSASDPIQSGFAASPGRPPRENVTGLSWFGADLAPPRLTLIHKLVPKPTLIGVLVDSNRPDASAQLPQLQAGADASRLKLTVLRAGSASEIQPAFASFAAQRVGALVVGASDFFVAHRDQLIELAALYRIPAIYPTREMAADGGLMSYGHSATDAFHRAGTYTGWILKGARPADLPILPSSKLELVINLRTAKALGLEVPQNLLAAADEVIQ